MMAPDIPVIITNLLQGIGGLESQYMKVIDLSLRIRKTANNFNQKLSFTGHSLGGGLATLAALTTNNKAVVYINDLTSNFSSVFLVKMN